MRLIDALLGRGSGGEPRILRAPDSPDPGRVPLGETLAGERVEWEPGDLHVGGYIGTGKSVALLTVLSHLFRHAAVWRTYLVDPKRIEFAHLTGHAAVEEVATDLESATRLLEDLRETERPGRTAVLIADAELLVYDPEGAAFRGHLEALLEAGGVHVVLDAQRPERLPLEGVEGMDVLRLRPGLGELGRAEFRPLGAAEGIELRTYYTGTADLEGRR